MLKSDVEMLGGVEEVGVLPRHKERGAKEGQESNGEGNSDEI